MRRRPFRDIPRDLTALLIAASVSAWPAQARAQGAPQCQPSGPVAAIPELTEASGIAISRRTPGRLWSHNDSSGAVLIALDTKGAVTGRVTTFQVHPGTEVSANDRQRLRQIERASALCARASSVRAPSRTAFG